MTYFLHQNDIPSDITFGNVIAIDTETMGLSLQRDRLCLIQLSSGDGNAHLIQVTNDNIKEKERFLNLKNILRDKNSTKLFHFARFDIAAIEKNICEINGSIYCTKIASKLSRTFGARHGLADLCKDLLGFELDKQNQTSDWGAEALSQSQLKYAASDVLYLHQIKEKLDLILKREDREDIAKSCFNFLKTRSKLDLIGFDNLDVFSH